MSKHTPGPWRKLVTRIDDSSGYQLCHLDLHGKSEAERDANAALIAAAPELLQVAIWNRDALDLSDVAFYDKNGFNVSEVIPRTRQVIKAATGAQA